MLKDPSEYINEHTLDTLSTEGLHIVQEAIAKAQMDGYEAAIKDVETMLSKVKKK